MRALDVDHTVARIGPQGERISSFPEIRALPEELRKAVTLTAQDVEDKLEKDTATLRGQNLNEGLKIALETKRARKMIKKGAGGLYVSMVDTVGDAPTVGRGRAACTSAWWTRSAMRRR